MNEEIRLQLTKIGNDAKKASNALSMASEDKKNQALMNMAELIENNQDEILKANNTDMKKAEEKGISDSFLDRLYLDKDRISSISNGLRSIVELNDPVGEEIGRWQRPNGLDISRVRTPLGVIGVIYESRPNVTADAGALCLKAGNAVILRGGSESFHSSNAIHKFLVQALEDSNLPKHSIQIIPTTDREAVGLLLGGLNGNIDVIVPRGGKSLVERVQNEAKIPVFGHLEGICHLYVDKSADLTKAKDIIINAKMRRPGICGAAETLLIDKNLSLIHI